MDWRNGERERKEPIKNENDGWLSNMEVVKSRRESQSSDSDGSFEIVHSEGKSSDDEFSKVEGFMPKVTFEKIFDVYPVDSDIIVRMVFKDGYARKNGDSVVLLPVGWKTTGEAVCSAMFYKNYLKVDANDIPMQVADNDQYYQLCYCTEDGDVMGISVPFSFRDMLEDELVEFYDDGVKKKSNIWRFRSRFAVLNYSFWKAITDPNSEDELEKNVPVKNGPVKKSVKEAVKEPVQESANEPMKESVKPRKEPVKELVKEKEEKSVGNGARAKVDQTGTVGLKPDGNDVSSRNKNGETCLKTIGNDVTDSKIPVSEGKKDQEQKPTENVEVKKKESKKNEGAKNMNIIVMGSVPAQCPPSKKECELISWLNGANDELPVKTDTSIDATEAHRQKLSEELTSLEAEQDKAAMPTSTLPFPKSSMKMPAPPYPETGHSCLLEGSSTNCGATFATRPDGTYIGNNAWSNRIGNYGWNDNWFASSRPSDSNSGMLHYLLSKIQEKGNIPAPECESREEDASSSSSSPIPNLVHRPLDPTACSYVPSYIVEEELNSSSPATKGSAPVSEAKVTDSLKSLCNQLQENMKEPSPYSANAVAGAVDHSVPLGLTKTPRCGSGCASSAFNDEGLPKLPPGFAYLGYPNKIAVLNPRPVRVNAVNPQSACDSAAAAQAAYMNAVKAQSVYGNAAAAQPAYGNVAAAQSAYTNAVIAQAAYINAVTMQPACRNAPTAQPMYGNMQAAQCAYGLRQANMATTQALCGNVPSAQPVYGNVAAAQSVYSNVPAAQSVYGNLPMAQSVYGNEPAAQSVYGNVPATQSIYNNLLSAPTSYKAYTNPPTGQNSHENNFQLRTGNDPTHGYWRMPDEVAGLSMNRNTSTSQASSAMACPPGRVSGQQTKLGITKRGQPEHQKEFTMEQLKKEIEYMKEQWKRQKETRLEVEHQLDNMVTTILDGSTTKEKILEWRKLAQLYRKQCDEEDAMMTGPIRPPANDEHYQLYWERYMEEIEELQERLNEASKEYAKLLIRYNRMKK